MKRITYNAVHVVLLFFLPAVLSCSAPFVDEAGREAARDHYLSGMQKFIAGDIKAAEEDFNRSSTLDQRSPYGWTGLAFLETTRANYRQALKHIGRALKYDDACAEAHAVKGNIFAVRKKGDNWYREALGEFDLALAIDPENERALFFLAECHLKARVYDGTNDLYSRVAGKKGSYASRARERAALVERIQKIAPVTESCGYIVLDDAIDRTDLAMLLEDEFCLRKRLSVLRPDIFSKFYNADMSAVAGGPRSPSDINGHRGRGQIAAIMPLGLSGVDLFPNGFFYPDRVLTRAQLAMNIQDVLMLLLGDSDIATRHVGAISRFTDVRTDFYAFNAVTLCVEEGIMEMDENAGSFKPAATVSGIEAFETIRRLARKLDSPILPAPVSERE